MSQSVAVTGAKGMGEAGNPIVSMDGIVGLNLWDLANALGVSRHKLFLAWVRGAPLTNFYISTAAWNAWWAANPF
jgi:hypothetical protein